MYRLLAGVHDFMARDVLSRPGAGSVRTVMNFSLGIRIPPEDAATFDHIPDVYNAMRIFENLMKLADCMGVFVAAASGNESDKFPAPQPMSFPAVLSTGKPDPLPKKVVHQLDNVLGVASCTIQKTISCFSNEGSITAPGGNGEDRVIVLPGILGAVERSLPWLIQWLGPDYYRRAAGKQGAKSGPFRHGNISFTEQCSPHTGVYSGPDCEFGVIGPIHDDTNTTSINFRYWAGTSFAAPLVSGLAALYASAGVRTPGDIRQVIENTVIMPPGRLTGTPPVTDGMGSGIIHIPERGPGQYAGNQSKG
jgi:subtilisin family serine protease